MRETGCVRLRVVGEGRIGWMDEGIAGWVCVGGRIAERNI